MIVIKRDGREVDFDKSKIFNAVYKAFEQLGKPVEEATQISGKIANEIESTNKNYTVEEIQDKRKEDKIPCHKSCIEQSPGEKESKTDFSFFPLVQGRGYELPQFEKNVGSSQHQGSQKRHPQMHHKLRGQFIIHQVDIGFNAKQTVGRKTRLCRRKYHGIKEIVFKAKEY